ncbi:hypothetical protein AAVH_30354, partial [Aphelenchoides avenae]
CSAATSRRDVFFYYDGRNDKKVYQAVFRYAQHGRTINVCKFSKAFKRIVETFVSYLRFCFVRGTIEIGCSRETLNIGQEFVERLKSIHGNYNCTKSSVCCGKISIMPGLDVFDLVCAFPHYRTMNTDTLKLLREHVGLNDGLLRSLASRGIWSQRDLRTRNVMISRSGMDGKEITEDGILDFAFGDYSGDEGGRRLHVNEPQISSRFISKLVEQCTLRVSFLAASGAVC